MIRWLKGLAAPQPLVQRFESETRKLAEDAETRGEVDATELARLKSMSELIELRRKARPLGRRRLGLGLKVSLVAVAVGSLFACHVRSTPIELTIVASNARFTGDSSQALVEAFKMKRLAIDSVSAVTVPPRLRSHTVPDTYVVTLVPLDTLATLTMDPLDIDTGSFAIWSVDPRAGSYAMRVSNLTDSVVTLGPKFWLISADTTRKVDFADERRVVLRRAKKPVTLSFDVAAPHVGTLVSPLWIRDAQFLRDTIVIKPLGGNGATIPHVEPISAIDSATITFLELNNHRVTIRAPERLRFTGHGGVNSLRLQDGKLHLSIAADVANIEKGLGESKWQSLQPTWFEWLRSRTYLAEAWTMLASVVALLFGAARYWGSPE